MHEGIIMKKKPLTIKQEQFSIKWIEYGGNATKAFKEVYTVGEDTKPETIWNSAHKVYTNPKVQARINELQAELIGTFTLDLNKRKNILANIAMNGNHKDSRGAIDLLNKIDGVYVEKQEVTLAGHITMLPAKDKDN